MTRQVSRQSKTSRVISGNIRALLRQLPQSTRTYQSGSRAGQKYTLKMTRGRPAIAPKPFIQPAFEVSSAPASELIINAAADVVQKVVSRNAEPRI